MLLSSGRQWASLTESDDPDLCAPAVTNNELLLVAASQGSRAPACTPVLQCPLRPSPILGHPPLRAQSCALSASPFHHPTGVLETNFQNISEIPSKHPYFSDIPTFLNSSLPNLTIHHIFARKLASKTCLKKHFQGLTRNTLFLHCFQYTDSGNPEKALTDLSPPPPHASKDL